MHLYDSIALYKALSPKKIHNAGQLVQSYLQSKYSKANRFKGMPMALSIEPTTSCNLRCPECPSGLRSFTRPTGMLNTAIYEKVLSELAETLIYLTFYFQGEPYLHPQFTELVSQATARNIYTATSTNAHYLTEEMAEKTVQSGLQRLIISIDGTTQQSYQNYRIGGKLAKVIEGTKNIIAAKKRLKAKTPHVIFQFLVVKPNEHQIADVKKLAKELGVDEVKLKTAQIYDYENGSDLIPTIDKYSRYRKLDSGKWEIKNPLENHCWRMWHSSVMTWDGQLVPCCFDKDAQHAMGNVQEHSFRSIWLSDTYQNFRAAVIRSRSEIDICTNCSEGSKVWA
jgi:radical SAM protein with 4Fe4S-binding SPASM domain